MNLHRALLKGGLIAAHRGHRAYFPENTMAAFQDCPGKCDFIEFDVRFSKDLVPVVFHDHTLERTSNIRTSGLFAGRENHPLEQFTFAELQQLDVGTWFYENDPFEMIANGKASSYPVANRHQTIADLDTVLAFIQNKGLAVNIEIKCLHKNRKKSAEKIIQSLNDYSIQPQCIISAFNHSILRLLKEIDQTIVTAALVEQRHPDKLLIYLTNMRASGYHIEDNMADENLFQAMAQAELFVSVYTVNSEQRKTQLLEMGVSAVFTDFLY